jgi:hypothetical protein|tara:strand:+ start:904 stop:1023 length:120 start_codon:yes stop_codon:yes gene_type:complete
MHNKPAPMINTMMNPSMIEEEAEAPVPSPNNAFVDHPDF